MRWVLALTAAFVGSLAALALAGALVLSFALPWLARGAAAGLEHARTTIESALPAEASPERVQETFEAARRALEQGRFDADAFRDALAWLPGALLDGQLDATETAALWQHLDRIADLGAPDAARDAAPGNAS